MKRKKHRLVKGTVSVGRKTPAHVSPKVHQRNPMKNRFTIETKYICGCCIVLFYWGGGQQTIKVSMMIGCISEHRRFYGAERGGGVRERE